MILEKELTEAWVASFPITSLRRCGFNRVLDGAIDGLWIDGATRTDKPDDTVIR